MRCAKLALAVLAAPVFACSLFAADPTAPPNFTGNWELDAAKSGVTTGETLSFAIQDSAGKINFTRTLRDKDGKEVVWQFSCKAGGTTCDFEEPGHKAKVSLWYDGASLVILRTDGPKEDSVSQWKLSLQPGGNVLHVEFSRIDPAGNTDNLVFAKKT